MSPTTGNNLVGAIAFYLYIVLALILLVIILQSIFDPNDRAPARLSSNHIISFSLATLSFASAARHMLRFLLVSYTDFARAATPPLPLPSSTSPRAILVFLCSNAFHPWSWATHASLFTDFATELFTSGRGDGRRAWTRATLVAAMLSSICSATAGQRAHLRHRWAFAVLAQVLPPGVSATLLYATLLQLSPSLPLENPRRLSMTYAVALFGVSTVFVACEGWAERLADERSAAWRPSSPSSLLWAVACGRALLLAPYILIEIGLREEPRVGTNDGEDPIARRDAMPGDDALVLSVAAAPLAPLLYGAAAEAVRSWSARSWLDAFASLASSHAVSAVGFDLVISILGAVTLYLARS